MPLFHDLHQLVADKLCLCLHVINNFEVKQKRNFNIIKNNGLDMTHDIPQLYSHCIRRSGVRNLKKVISAVPSN